MKARENLAVLPRVAAGRSGEPEYGEIGCHRVLARA